MAIERSVGVVYNDPMDVDFIEYDQALPNEIILNEIVFKNLSGKELGALVLTNRRLSQLASNPILWRILFDREGLPYFDETKCLKYRGNPGTVPPLSWPRAYGFSNSPCTLPRALFEPEKLRKHTHKLQLFYSKLDNHPTTLNLVGEQAKTPKPGSGGSEACICEDSWEPALVAYGDEPLGDPFWGFFVRKPLGHGESKTAEEKVARAKLYPQYSIARPVERAIGNFDSVVEGDGYIDGPDTYAICDAIVKHDFGEGVIREVLVAIGGARAPAGLSVPLHFSFFVSAIVGVALLRKF